MANELTVSVTTEYTKGNVEILARRISKDVTVSGNIVLEVAQSIGTSDETLALGEVATPLVGYVQFYNADTTNYIEIGNAAATYQLKLKAGEVAVLRLDSWNAIYAKANTAACVLQYRIFSD